jgi:hypothetical protein
MIQEEQEEREDTLAEVIDPTFLIVRDTDADGEPDEGGFSFESPEVHDGGTLTEIDV